MELATWVAAKHFDMRITEHLNDNKNKVCKNKTTKEKYLRFWIMQEQFTNWHLRGISHQMAQASITQTKSTLGYYLVGLGFMSPEDHSSLQLHLFIVYLL